MRKQSRPAKARKKRLRKKPSRAVVPGLRGEPPHDMGLSAEFRASLSPSSSFDSAGLQRAFKGQTPSPRAASADKEQVVMMIRAPEAEVGLGLDNRFVAVNRTTYAGPPQEIESATHQRFWDARMEHVRPLAGHADFLKSGADIYQRMGLHMPLHVTRALLGLKTIDQETACAAQVAMFSTFNTSAAIPDMENINFTISTFCHAHPYFRRMWADGQFHLPYGDNTVYKLMKPHGFIFD